MPFLARVYRRDRIGRSIPRFVRSTKIEKSLRLCGLNVCPRRVCFPYRGRRRSVFEFTHAAAAVHRRKAEFLFRRTARCDRVPVLQRKRTRRRYRIEIHIIDQRLVSELVRRVKAVQTVRRRSRKSFTCRACGRIRAAVRCHPIQFINAASRIARPYRKRLIRIFARR